MKEINKPVFLWVAGVCILLLILILIRDLIQGNEKIIFNTKDYVIFFTLAGGIFLSWHMIGEIKMKLKDSND